MEEILKEIPSEQKELIHILHKFQEKYGHIPPEAVSRIAGHLKMSESEMFGVLTFYRAFSLEPRGQHVFTICTGTACHVRGAQRIVEEFTRALGVEPGKTTADRLFTLETVNCVGACALGPIVIADGVYHGQMKTTEVGKIVKDCRQKTEG